MKRKQILFAVVGVAVLMGALALLGCNEKKEAAPPAETTSAPHAASAVKAEPAPAAEPKPAEAKPPEAAVPDAKAPAAVGATGTLSGVVTLTGEAPVMQPLKRGADPICGKTPMNDETVLVKDGKIQNVAIRLLDAPKATVPAPAPVEIDQEACMYRPRVQVAQEGQPLLIKNSDGTLHNVHSYLGSKTIFNQAQPPKSAPVEKPAITPSEVVKLKCDVHPWMTGYVLYSPNGFSAVSDAGGKFELKNVPPGTYTLETWHERFGKKTQKVTVTAGNTTAVAAEYSADDRG